jgi:hypothetical protein
MIFDENELTKFDAQMDFLIMINERLADNSYIFRDFDEKYLSGNHTNWGVFF